MVLDLLNHLCASIAWQSSDNRKTFICLDKSISEVLKWCDVSSNHKAADKLLFLKYFTVLSFDEEARIQSTFSSKQFERTLFITSVLNVERIQIMKDLLQRSGSPECAIISTLSPVSATVQYFADTTTTADRNAYQSICNVLEPAVTAIYYLPVHLIDLYPLAQSPVHVELKLVASTQFHNTMPLNLSTLGISTDSRSEYQRSSISSLIVFY
jgi:hypothetical protein